jgi:hypothetical protein
VYARAVTETEKPTETQPDGDREPLSPTLRLWRSAAAPAGGDCDYNYDALSAPAQSGAQSSGTERSAVPWPVRIPIRMARELARHRRGSSSEQPLDVGHVGGREPTLINPEFDHFSVGIPSRDHSALA